MEGMHNEKINGFDTEALKQVMGEVSRDPAKGKVKFQVSSSWKGGTRSDTRVESYQLAGKEIKKDFTISIDEPEELLGSNTAPNPQETLMAAFNACMLVGYVTGSSFKGIELEKLEIDTEGELDLRGFLGLDKSVKPGYEEIRYTVRVKGNGTLEQFQEIHETVMATSPNRWNIANPISLVSDLIVE
ncbi:MAG: OsmC family protein [Planctomycetota bacterium]|jgi:uncharacterized OsmC-like protein